MNSPTKHTRAPARRWRLPRWMALILTSVVLLLGHVVVPQQLSLLSARHGWAHGEPGWLNLLGVIPIGVGAAFLIWSFRLHFVGVRGSFEMKGTQNYLVVGGPYSFTRNPMYFFGMLIWLGWVIFYGSVAVLAGAVIIWGIVAMRVVPWEERNLETRFGEAYLQYMHSVPRWSGRRSR
jgi:protein-S-isoprenylcysteine O-methyltransferase Ste14